MPSRCCRRPAAPRRAPTPSIRSRAHEPARNLPGPPSAATSGCVRWPVDRVIGRNTTVDRARGRGPRRGRLGRSATRSSSATPTAAARRRPSASARSGCARRPRPRRARPTRSSPSASRRPSSAASPRRAPPSSARSRPSRSARPRQSARRTPSASAGDERQGRGEAGGGARGARAQGALEQLETKADALEEREEALVAKDEAKRLKQSRPGRRRRKADALEVPGAGVKRAIAGQKGPRVAREQELSTTAQAARSTQTWTNSAREGARVF